MSSTKTTDILNTASHKNDYDDLTNRLEQAFQAEELAASKRAMQVSLGVIAAIIVLVFVIVPLNEVPFFVSILITASMLVIMHTAIRNSRFGRQWHSYVFVLILFFLLAFTAFFPNPAAPPWPPQMTPRYSLFVYSFILLVPFVFSYSPSLMLWAGFSSVITWSLGLIWLYSLPDTISESPSLSLTSEQRLVAWLNPYYVNSNIWIQNIVVILIVSAALAIAVARARKMVHRQASLERERTNLARYFPPNVVDRLAEQDEHLDTARSQSVAVLFADIVGFTRLAEHTSPEDTFSLLRNFHERLENVVFEHNGTLDKFLGDGIMATFGTPDVGSHDAVDAINCAKAMLDSIDHRNMQRKQSHDPPIILSIGIHFGSVILGNIGSARQLEFAVLGDVVNVSSRLEELSRKLNCQMVVGSSLIMAAREQTGTGAEELLNGFVDMGVQKIRGRDADVSVWSYPNAVT